MEIIALIIVMGLSLALIFALPFGIAKLGYNFLKRKQVSFYLRWISIIPAILLLYLLAFVLLPDKHLNKLDYTEIMAYPFPNDATLIYEESKKGDNFAFGMKTSPQKYRFVCDILQRRGFVKDSTINIPDTILSYVTKKGEKIMLQLSLTRYSHFNYYIDLLSDSSTIFMRKVSKQ